MRVRHRLGPAWGQGRPGLKSRRWILRGLHGSVVPVVGAESSDLLTNLLRDVSRSFYLTLRILPGGIGRPIGLAYLLARATDTIADTGLIPVSERLDALDALRARILGNRGVPLDFRRIVEAQEDGASPAERLLLGRVEEAIAALQRMDAGDIGRIRSVLDVITGGQELDLRRFGSIPKGGLGALPDAEALDDYTYRVAGCVGEFWTRMCVAHLFRVGAEEEARMLRDGIRFGQGLQLVNILRDLPKDLGNGRCYLPLDELARIGMVPGDLRDPANERRLWPVYERWLVRAEGHLDAGWAYTVALPRGQVRMRLACAWPVLLGIRTLVKLRGGGVLDPARRIKVSRAEVKAVMWRSIVRLPLGRSWNGLAEWARNAG
jgi:farnesyl-diphosphate farnesyltransferase